ncbi:hypothetical protein Tco_1071693, partial [Tanacetum coccineum]
LFIFLSDDLLPSTPQSGVRFGLVSPQPHPRGDGLMVISSLLFSWLQTDMHTIRGVRSPPETPQSGVRFGSAFYSPVGAFGSMVSNSYGAFGLTATPLGCVWINKTQTGVFGLGQPIRGRLFCCSAAPKVLIMRGKNIVIWIDEKYEILYFKIHGNVVQMARSCQNLSAPQPHHWCRACGGATTRGASVSLSRCDATACDGAVTAVATTAAPWWCRACGGDSPFC